MLLIWLLASNLTISTIANFFYTEQWLKIVAGNQMAVHSTVYLHWHTLSPLLVTTPHSLQTAIPEHLEDSMQCYKVGLGDGWQTYKSTHGSSFCFCIGILNIIFPLTPTPPKKDLGQLCTTGNNYTLLLNLHNIKNKFGTFPWYIYI